MIESCIFKPLRGLAVQQMPTEKDQLVENLSTGPNPALVNRQFLSFFKKSTGGYSWYILSHPPKGWDQTAENSTHFPKETDGDLLPGQRRSVHLGANLEQELLYGASGLLKSSFIMVLALVLVHVTFWLHDVTQNYIPFAKKTSSHRPLTPKPLRNLLPWICLPEALKKKNRPWGVCKIKNLKKKFYLKKIEKMKKKN